MAATRDRIDELRAFYAELVAGSFAESNPRLRQVFEAVPREAFLPPGPWKIFRFDGYVETPDADPTFIYQDVLVALDADQGINNGQPSLHAAMLAMLVLPAGNVTAYEIDPALAAAAEQNLQPFENVVVTAADAARQALPTADLIYVNAGVSAPPVAWLEALGPGGRIVMPWHPSDAVGLALRIIANAGGFAVEPVMPCWFIPCIGASEEACQGPAPTLARAFETRSLWRRVDRQPDESAIAVFEDLWFSSEEVPARAALQSCSERMRSQTGRKS